MKDQDEENIIFPFYIEEDAVYDRSFFEGKKTVYIRGVECILKKYPNKIPFFNKEGLINEIAVSCWQPVILDQDLLKTGLDLIETGIGFKKTTNQ